MSNIVRNLKKMEQSDDECNDTRKWYKNICSIIPKKKHLIDYMCHDFDEHKHYPNYQDLYYMSYEELIQRLKNDLKFEPHHEISKQILIDILSDYYVSIHMQAYLKTLKEYTDNMITCAEARERHFQMCISTGKWKNGSKEDKRHRNWREGYTYYSRKCLETYHHWDKEHGILTTRLQERLKYLGTLKNVAPRKKKKFFKPKRIFRERVDVAEDPETIEYFANMLSEGYDGHNPEYDEDYDVVETSLSQTKGEDIMGTSSSQTSNEDIVETSLSKTNNEDDTSSSSKLKEKLMIAAKAKLEERRQRQLQKDKDDYEALKTVEKQQKNHYKTFMKKLNNQTHKDYSSFNVDAYIKKLEKMSCAEVLQEEPGIPNIVELPLKETHVQALSKIFIDNFETDIRCVTLLIDTLVLNDPEITKDDLSKRNLKDFFSGKRNTEKDMISRRIYLWFTFHLSQTYLTKAILSSDVQWNRALLYRIMALFNRNLVEYVGTMLLKRDNAGEIDYQFVGLLPHYIDARTSILADALQEYYFPHLPELCFALEYHLRKHTKWLIEQRTKDPIMIPYKLVGENRKRWTLVIQPNDPNSDGNKMMREVYKNYREHCEKR